MNKTIKELQAQGLSKSLIYEALKTVLPFSKQFQKNKRFFDEKDIEIFEYYKNYGSEKTVLKFWTSQKVGNSETVWKQSLNSNKNSLETVDTDIEKAVKKEIETVTKQFEDREEELNQTISQKEAIIKMKDEQTQKYALLKTEEKKEKEEWIKKYDNVQKEKNDWVGKYYSIKMYMIVFLILLILSSVFIIFQNIK